MAAFWLEAVLFGFVLLTSAAASPLYAVYQGQWKFSATTLTAVFAIYAIFLLLTLLLFGSVADYLGRRSVIFSAINITAAACALFLAADGVGLLFAARALQGVAVGMTTGGLGAALIDLQPEVGRLASVATNASLLLGLAVGALASSALAIETRSAAGLFIGAAVAGAGVGAGNLGAYRTLTALVPAHHRA
ncbi:MFS transporter, partial [Pseudonocardia sp.]|uniref:MFS transporter n=1 Tax=Pseudonocardia sp. TaxID=60912 RepID=UPI002612E346